MSFAKTLTLLTSGANHPYWVSKDFYSLLRWIHLPLCMEKGSIGKYDPLHLGIANCHMIDSWHKTAPVGIKCPANSVYSKPSGVWSLLRPLCSSPFWFSPSYLILASHQPADGCQSVYTELQNSNATNARMYPTYSAWTLWTQGDTVGSLYRGMSSIICDT